MAGAMVSKDRKTQTICGDREMSHGAILLLMTAFFLVFGYMGVPVAFALMAGVLAACMLTPISMQSMIGQMFHGINSEILLAVPFFLLVGELMTSAERHQPHDPPGADHGRPYARRAGAGRHRCSACSLPAFPARPPPTSRC